MQEDADNRGTLCFTLAGVPVFIRPISWVMLALIGGGLQVNDRSGLAQVLMFVAAGMVALLAHEFGHALVGRRVGAGDACITIAGLGGVTQHRHLPPTRAGYLAMVAAGPLASLALGLAAGLLLGSAIGHPVAGLFSAVLLPLPSAVPVPEVFVQAFTQGLMLHPLPPLLLKGCLLLMSICFWWTVFNLLPIFPLDGGKLLGTLLHNDRKACMVGLVFSVLLVLWSLATFNWFNIMITSWLAVINYHYYRALS